MTPTRTLRNLILMATLFLGMATHAQQPQLWGMTRNGGANDLGTIFRMDLDGSDFEVVHSFDGTGGSNPEGGLCLAANGDLYGLAKDGGANTFGTVFRISPTTLEYTVVADLTGSVGGFP